MYNFSKEELQLLKTIGRGEVGRKFVDLLERMTRKISDVSDIEGDYGAKVEGKKLTKNFIKDLIYNISKKEQSADVEEDTDDFE